MIWKPTNRISFRCERPVKEDIAKYAPVLNISPNEVMRCGVRRFIREYSEGHSPIQIKAEESATMTLRLPSWMIDELHLISYETHIGLSHILRGIAYDQLGILMADIERHRSVPLSESVYRAKRNLDRIADEEAKLIKKYCMTE